jgi:hypothetical protein
MVRAILSAAILLAGAGISQAQTINCYPHIGAYSGQYEGQCPASSLKWTVFENTVGAFGRNCNDAPWTYNRTEKMFYNQRDNEKFPMQDCSAPSREQRESNTVTNLGSENVRRFHEGKIQPADASLRKMIEVR